MVTSVTNFGRSGLYDWLFQRVSAAILTAYTIFIVAYIYTHPGLTYDEWSELFSHFWMRFFSLLTLLSLAGHSWIGLWGVLTDYVTPLQMGSKATFVRISLQLILFTVTVAYTVWGIEILWGI
ncbi:succinate dehydrogenase, hydrophobic membrane anchor protein [Aurantivibrio plasticivorans]